MKQKRNYDKLRPALEARPWLKNSLYDLMTSFSVLHADIYAKRIIDGAVFFVIEYRRGGKELLAIDYISVQSDGSLMLVPPVTGLTEIYWTRAAHAGFRAYHSSLVAYVNAVKLTGINRVTAQYHYVRQIDRDPWPRGFVNYKTAGAGPAPKRKRRTKAEMEIARAVEAAGVIPGTLPDWL